MSKYVDGYVLPVRSDKLEEYRRIAQEGAKVWREHGALEYYEWVADDVQPGKLTSFPQSVDLQPGETVIFAYIVFRSREHRDQVNALAMSDPRLANMDPATMPFDGKRMIFGGFTLLVGG
ncbi:MAG: DUF1428 domain-containing protein [Polyangiaceae bacterium]|nr:DUF1428 domain-containing protein [Polyangiaceae bacterium]